MKTAREWIAEAVAHERAARWSAASAARAAAMALPPESAAAKPDPSALTPGTVLRHMRWGKCEAECTYVGGGDYRVDGVSYPSLAKAADAAAAALGKKTKSNHGPIFWGLKKQEQADPDGFDQTRTDPDLEEDDDGE